MNQLGRYIEFLREEAKPVSIEAIMDKIGCDRHRAAKLAVVAKSEHKAVIRKTVTYELIECKEMRQKCDYKADILGVITACTEDEFTARELAGLLQCNDQLVRTYLRQLHDQGKIKVRKVKRENYWSCV